MIYILQTYCNVAVFVLLLLAITVSSKQCHEKNVIQVTGGTYEASQSGDYYGIISTPNFPEPFKTPFSRSWVIDASHLKNGTQINVYLTQMYLIQGVRFFQHPTYEFCESSRKTRGPRKSCMPEDEKNTEIYFDKLHSLVKVRTSCPYLEIEVNVPTLYGYHYRTQDRFLVDIYGFNLTYEIVPMSKGLKNDSCTPTNCSSLGHCYIAHNWRDFFCDCVRGRGGKFCENDGQTCDPENNITFCLNGGKCGFYGTGARYCLCPPTFKGPHCEEPKIELPKVSARTAECSSSTECSLQETKPICTVANPDPCSCRPKPRNSELDYIPKDWVKYEAIISISPDIDPNLNLNLITAEMKSSIKTWLNSKKMSEFQNIDVKISFSQRHFHLEIPFSKELFIHMHGPFNRSSDVSSILKQWLTNKTTYHFHSQIPLMEDTFEIFTMPRVKYKSIGFARMKIGSSGSITCTAITGPSRLLADKDIRFRWFKDDMLINETMISTSTRHAMSNVQHHSGNEYMSVLIIDPVSIYDRGFYKCEITDVAFGEQVCGKERVEVAMAPQVEVDPMSLTLEKQKPGKGVVIFCTDGTHFPYSSENKSTEFEWSRSGISNGHDVVVEDLIPQGKMLRILKAEHSESFTCKASNSEGHKSAKVEVKVLDSKNSPSCKRHWERLVKSDKESLLWEWTAPDTDAIIPCPKSFIGHIRRPCILNKNGSKAYWGRSSFSHCFAKYLSKVNKTMQNAMRGFGDWQAANGVNLMTQVEKYLNENKMLYPGEGEKIIILVRDIVKYSFGSQNGKVTDLFPVFFRTVVKLLKAKHSCFEEKSVLALCQLIVDLAVRRAMQVIADSESNSVQIEISDMLMLQTLSISTNAEYRDLAYIFPKREVVVSDPTLSWLKDKLWVSFPLDSKGLRKDDNSPVMHYLVMAAYKNLSSILVPNDAQIEQNSRRKIKNIRTSVDLISPAVQISIPEGYYLPPESHIKIHFNLSKEHRSLLSSRSILPDMPPTRIIPSTIKGTFFSCGALENSTVSFPPVYGRMPWSMNACTINVYKDSLVECQCEVFGIFGLLKVTNFEDEIPRVNNEMPKIVALGFSLCILSCVLSATILCIYLKCRISLNSLYALKLFDCFFIFSAVFIILMGRTEFPTASWLVWSATACSFLITSLSVQVTKALRVLLMEAKPDLPGFIFPWLRDVSQVTLLSGIAFSAVLPVWTATVAKLIGSNTSNESVFDESSHVFAVFVGIVGLEVLFFFGIYYRAVLKTKGELDGFQQQILNTNAASSTFTSDMIWILKYRIKTLNRSFGLTLVLLVMILGIILYENLRHSLYIQYFLGLSATMMGTVLFLSYITHCEYPLCTNLGSQNLSEKPPRRDPEKQGQEEKNGSRRKLYDISSDVAGNGLVVGSTGLLSRPQPILRNQTRHLGEESETLSVSTVEEQSMDTFSTDVSFRQSSQTNKMQPLNNKRARSIRSAGSNTVSSSGSSYRSRKYPSTCSSRELPVPRKGTCLILRDKDAGEYIMPTVHHTNGTSSTSVVTERSNGTVVPTTEAISMGSASSYNYLPINDHDDLQKKISHDLKLLLPDKFTCQD